MQRMEARMNGNYEFNRHMATDKQRTLIREAERHRQAKRARDKSEIRLIWAFIVRTSTLLKESAQRAFRWAAGRLSSWETVSSQSRTATD